MKKLTMILAVLALVLCACACAEENGILADMTEQAATLTDESTRSYQYCYYDWDEDGEDELFFLQAFDDGDGKWPMNAAIYSGPELSDTRWTPPKMFKDVAEILTVCFIDIDPADGAKDLVFSVTTPDGKDQTMILRGVLTATDDAFGRMWMDPQGNKIISGRFHGVVDGGIAIGDRVFANDSAYYLLEVGPFEPSMVPPDGGTDPDPQPEAPDATAAPEATEIPAAPEATEEPQPADTPAPEAPRPDGAGILMDTCYTAVRIVSAGGEVPVSPESGGYAVTLHADGTLEFRMSGVDVPGLTWATDGGDVVIDYFGAGQLRLTAADEGVLLDYMGGMKMVMVP